MLKKEADEAKYRFFQLVDKGTVANKNK